MRPTRWPDAAHIRIVETMTQNTLVLDYVLWLGWLIRVGLEAARQRADLA